MTKARRRLGAFRRFVILKDDVAISEIRLDREPAADELEEGARAVEIDEGEPIELGGTVDAKGKYVPPDKVKMHGIEGSLVVVAVVDVETRMIANMIVAVEGEQLPEIAGVELVVTDGSYAIGGAIAADGTYTPPPPGEDYPPEHLRGQQQ